MNLSDRILLIVNPNSNDKRPKHKLKKVISWLNSWNINYDIEFPDNKKETLDLVSTDYEHEIIIGANGDGGQNAIVQGAMKNPLEKFLAMIPEGIANDTSKVFEACSTREKFYNSLKCKNTKETDVGLVNSEYFLLYFSIGFDVVTLEEREKRRFLKGKSAYYPAALRAFLKSCPLEMEIKFKDKKIQDKFFMAVFSNLGPYADGLKICPDANPYDEKLDLCLIKGKPNLLRLTNLMLLARHGKHVNNPEVFCYQSNNFEIFTSISVPYQIDGDLIQRKSDHFKIRIADKKIKMLV